VNHSRPVRKPVAVEVAARLDAQLILAAQRGFQEGGRVVEVLARGRGRRAPADEQRRQRQAEAAQGFSVDSGHLDFYPRK
jgi:hypothetical protein